MSATTANISTPVEARRFRDLYDVREVVRDNTFGLLMSSCSSYFDFSQIGRGTFSEVRRCIHIQSGTEYAVKINSMCDIASNRLDALKLEISLLKMVTSPNVVKFQDFFEDDESIVLVMEWARGGELYNHLHMMKRISEDDCRIAIRALLLAVKSCHDLRIVHRDIKLENILLSNNSEDLPVDFSTLKLSDFGFAVIAENDECLTTQCGGLHYISPEILRCLPYGRPVDMWSIGIVTYVLLCGYFPFHCASKVTMIQLIIEGKFKFHAPNWDGISASVKDFISQLINIDFHTRLTVDEAMAHRWLLQSEASPLII